MRPRKRAKPGAAAFLTNLEKDILFPERELWSGRYTPGRYRTIEVFDSKHRVVSAAPFRDRVVQHALCAVVKPKHQIGMRQGTKGLIGRPPRAVQG